VVAVGYVDGMHHIKHSSASCYNKVLFVYWIFWRRGLAAAASPGSVGLADCGGWNALVITGH